MPTTRIFLLLSTLLLLSGLAPGCLPAKLTLGQIFGDRSEIDAPDLAALPDLADADSVGPQDFPTFDILPDSPDLESADIQPADVLSDQTDADASDQPNPDVADLGMLDADFDVALDLASDLSDVPTDIGEPLLVSITSMPSASSDDRLAIFEFSCSDPPCTFECQLNDDDPWEACSSPKLYLDLDFGSNTFRVRAKKAQRQSDPAVWTWEIVGWVSVSAQQDNTCAIKTDGTLWCWGHNEFGQVGNGDSGVGKKVSKPSQVGADSNWDTVSLGAEHVCGLKDNGTLFCWGSNAQGQIGDGNGADGVKSTVPAQVDASTWVQVSSGALSTCAIKADKSLWCWGSDTNEQLGNPENADSLKPLRVGVANDWTWIAAGDIHTCGIRAERSGNNLYCWGSNSAGQLGLGTMLGSKPTPERVGTDTDWVKVMAGKEYTCGIKSTAALFCWGINFKGQIGNGDSGSGKFQTTPAEIIAALGANQSADLAHEHTCAVDSTDALLCWGKNDVGQLGTNSTSTTVVPSPAPAIGSDWSVVALGRLHTCALKLNGSLFCWGSSSSGQIGNGTEFGTVTQQSQVSAVVP